MEQKNLLGLNCLFEIQATSVHFFERYVGSLSEWSDAADIAKWNWTVKFLKRAKILPISVFVTQMRWLANGLSYKWNIIGAPNGYYAQLTRLWRHGHGCCGSQVRKDWISLDPIRYLVYYLKIFEENKTCSKKTYWTNKLKNQCFFKKPSQLLWSSKLKTIWWLSNLFLVRFKLTLGKNW